MNIYSCIAIVGISILAVTYLDARRDKERKETIMATAEAMHDVADSVRNFRVRIGNENLRTGFGMFDRAMQRRISSSQVENGSGVAAYRSKVIPLAD